MPTLKMPHESVNGMIQTLESTVQFFREKNPYFDSHDRIYIRQQFRVDVNGYFDEPVCDSEGDTVEAIRSVTVELEYMVRKHGRSVRVRWRPIWEISGDLDLETHQRINALRKHYLKADWNETADHSSCWRHNSFELTNWIREKLSSEVEYTHTHTFANADCFKILTTEEA